MAMGTFKVGELARRTGLTIRTLHYYDEVGLLRPSLHTESGHRLYTGRDVARLQQVLSLRQLGFSLEEARDCLDGDGVAPLELIRSHVDQLRQQIELQKDLCNRLEGLLRYFERAGEVPAEQFLDTIEAMTKMIENYYTPEQLDYLKKRREQISDDAIRAAEKEWPELMAKVKAEMEAGTDPADPRVQALMQRWRELIHSFTGGDPGIQASLNRMWKEQGTTLAAQHNLPFDARMDEYVRKAMAAGKK